MEKVLLTGGGMSHDKKEPPLLPTADFFLIRTFSLSLSPFLTKWMQFSRFFLLYVYRYTIVYDELKKKIVVVFSLFSLEQEEKKNYFFFVNQTVTVKEKKNS